MAKKIEAELRGIKPKEIKQFEYNNYINSVIKEC
jgi:hypothetical protein